MARNRREGQPGKLDPHPLVQKLSDGGGEPQNTVAIHGYPGQAPADGEWLLWLSLAFTDSVQGRDEDIVHSETLPDDQGTVLYVKADAKLQHRHVQTQNVEASFLGGGIAGGLTAGAAAGPMAPAGGAAIRASVSPACFGTAACTVFTQCATCFTCVTHCGTCATCPTHCFTCVTCRTCFRTCQILCTLSPLVCFGNPGGGQFASFLCPE
jgi:hypothetical protein